MLIEKTNLQSQGMFKMSAIGKQTCWPLNMCTVYSNSSRRRRRRRRKRTRTKTRTKRLTEIGGTLHKSSLGCDALIQR